MTTIKLYRDDSGIRQLQNQNENEIEPATDDVDQVRPYPEIKPMAPKQFDLPDREQGHRPYTDSPHTPKPLNRRGPDRRRRQRRHHNEQVMLDTRSRHERRTRLRRKLDKSPLSGQAADSGGENMPPGIGIDRYI